MPKATSVNLANDVRYWAEKYSRTFDVSMSAIFNEAFRQWFRSLSDEQRYLMQTERRKPNDILREPPLDIPK